jgi:hypothetical protein
LLVTHAAAERAGAAWSMIKVGSSSEGTANMEKKERQAAQSIGPPLPAHVGR